MVFNRTNRELPSQPYLITHFLGVLKPLGECSTSCLEVHLEAVAMHGKSTRTVTAQHNQKYIDQCAKFREFVGFVDGHFLVVGAAAGFDSAL